MKCQTKGERITFLFMSVLFKISSSSLNYLLKSTSDLGAHCMHCFGVYFVPAFHELSLKRVNTGVGHSTGFAL